MKYPFYKLFNKKNNYNLEIKFKYNLYVINFNTNTKFYLI